MFIEEVYKNDSFRQVYLYIPFGKIEEAMKYLVFNAFIFKVEAVYGYHDVNGTQCINIATIMDGDYVNTIVDDLIKKGCIIKADNYAINKYV